MLTKGDEEKVSRIVVDAIQQVVIPAMDRMEDDFGKRMDGLDQRMGGLEQRMDKLAGTVEHIDRKLGLATEKIPLHGHQLAGHEKRLGVLEQGKNLA